MLSRLLRRRIYTTKELVNGTAQGRVCTAEGTKCMERQGLAHGRGGQVGPLWGGSFGSQTHKKRSTSMKRWNLVLQAEVGAQQRQRVKRKDPLWWQKQGGKGASARNTAEGHASGKVCQASVCATKATQKLCTKMTWSQLYFKRITAVWKVDWRAAKQNLGWLWSPTQESSRKERY